MKHFLKNNWKTLLIILIIIFGFVIWYEILPRYNLGVANFGYDKCLNDLMNNQVIPLPVTQGNQTQRTLVPICSEFFVQQYPNMCEVQG